MRSTKARSVLSIVVYSLLISSIFIVAGCDTKKGTSTSVLPGTRVSIVYNLNGATRGTAPTDSASYALNVQIPVKAVPAGLTKTGKNLDTTKWNTQADGGGTDVAADSNVTLDAVLMRIAAQNNNTLILYAKWTDRTYSVTYNLNGGRGTAPSDSNTYRVNQDVTAASLPAGVTPPTDKRFGGWNTQADGGGTDVQAGGTIRMVSGGLTLYAKWIDRTYSVTYNLNGGRGTAPSDSNTYRVNQDVTAAASLPAGVRPPTDKRFDGWNTQADGGGTDVAAGGTISMISGGLTLYAKWIDRTYSVTYNLNGASAGTAPTDPNRYAVGAQVTAAALPAGVTGPAGRTTFGGWHTTRDGTSGTDVAAGGTTRMVSGGLTLYAKWS